ncbi:MAG: ABC transporter ATP-binding protein [Ilumatobacteraceae bacterium]|jgi:spermidine/putrescine transport system ATP-binding protein|nr:ABC transporter ATP-binding protein [Acidimicrobiaceae bacterium]MBP6487715.1 ABC transporter ATP-binding protein [Ilumatobacteraceae bacterium]MBP7887748.1 ABC transporter ATP-binding protein [Ilumatobacteraceae bacterium]MBP8209621.1 ABC transporter ATP-binding protein [Ilumatobacteraceae bacterium]MBP9053252.1 ABC transporter ATP-binding protein [Ilumatobacteraceae bacterium]
MGEQRVSGGGRIELESLSKWYGEQQVLDAIDLIIEPGEFFSLLGPSGCGKTTTLRLIGGFEEIEHGAVRIDGADMRGVPPEKRPVNTVFQSYALFPHKSVAENVAFGLRFQPCDKAETKRRVGEALELVRLTGYEARKPHQLSGGQQQRVALARSLVLRPKVLLLDEPLGALDAKLRRVLQVELRSLHREVGITFVYVTHDQEEALTMSDRLAVMNTGRIEQVGGPRSVYDEPANRYVADFLGLANLLPATADAAGVTVLGARVAADTRGLAGASTVLVRPERVQLVAPSSGQLQGRVQHVVFAGAATHVHMRVGDHDLQAVVPNDGSALAAVEGGDVGLVLAADALRVLAD